MTVRVAVNGLGRIGRALLRLATTRGDFTVVAANDLAPIEQLLPLVARDSVHGRFPGEVSRRGSSLVLAGDEVPLSREEIPGRIPWAGASPQVVVDATGTLGSRDEAAAHLGGSVSHAIV